MVSLFGPGFDSLRLHPLKTESVDKSTDSVFFFMIGSNLGSNFRRFGGNAPQTVGA